MGSGYRAGQTKALRWGGQIANCPKGKRGGGKWHLREGQRWEQGGKPGLGFFTRPLPHGGMTCSLQHLVPLGLSELPGKKKLHLSKGD